MTHLISDALNLQCLRRYSNGDTTGYVGSKLQEDSAEDKKIMVSWKIEKSKGFLEEKSGEWNQMPQRSPIE